MFDFLEISETETKSGTEIKPKFTIQKSKDLMIRGSDFYAIWVEQRGLWSLDEDDALQLIDNEVNNYVEENKGRLGARYRVLHIRDAENGIIDKWHRFCQKQSRDSYHQLDAKIIFSNQETKREDYASKKLPYPLEETDISGYEKLMSTLYDPGERHKIEWAIGSIVAGASADLQKFMVLYGAAGTGKSTVLNIIEKLFEGYTSAFNAKALGSSSDVFALESFKSNPLVAIQHDGDLSRIEDNTRLNSLVSHEVMSVNEKFKSVYNTKFNAFLFMGTNKPVKITDAKSGLIRRLIDVKPSGRKLSRNEYNKAVEKVKFELGGIAMRCKNIYLQNPNYYDSYVPETMMDASNDFYNFVMESFLIFKKSGDVSLKIAWSMYNNYCEEAKVQYRMSRRVFKEEFKNYFKEYDKTEQIFKGFIVDKFKNEIVEDEEPEYVINFGDYPSKLDEAFSDFKAQYAGSDEKPKRAWDKVETLLSDLDTKKLHYVLVPEESHFIFIDFDLKDKNGNKDFAKNLEAASKFPPTYAEVSKSGAGIHLHYLYSGEVSKLAPTYAEGIEIKVPKGNSALRRKLSKCNNLEITKISSGLPLKGGVKKDLISNEKIKSEKSLRSMIIRNVNKEFHPATKPSIDFIKKILDDCYDSGLSYDISDMEPLITNFAANSTNHATYCLRLVGDMKFKSEDKMSDVRTEIIKAANNEPLVFVDCEVFPNLLLVNYKVAGEGNPVVRLINPTPQDIEELSKFKLVGFNVRRYDNHILYARMLGRNNKAIYDLSRDIIDNHTGFIGEAYNLSYTDIYDFLAAQNKMSLKKWEIKLGIHHHELGLPWDKPVPEEKWEMVAEYCDDDVIATEAVFNANPADWTARQILADLAEMTVNDTTNTLTTKIIFGYEREPQRYFMYRNLAEPVFELPTDVYEFLKEACPVMMSRSHGEAKSLLPYFPGYVFSNGKSTYKGVEVGEGGRVYAEPGMYFDVALLDVASMHPHSTIAECLFGVEFTKAYREIVEGRVDIKHEAWDKCNDILGGKLAPYIEKVKRGEMTSGDLANALKTAINSVYGLTSASFMNAFKDLRNKDNIVAKRGALFMIDLTEEVQKKGFKVAHIKTDSIKIPNATPEIIKFVMDFGEMYGYTFEHEATYDRMCLVNKAVYIAKYKDAAECEKMYGYSPKDNKKHGGEWTATGEQFAVPYVFKTLFSHEPIEFKDMCETFEVKSALYLDFNEALPDVSAAEKELEKLESKYKKGQLSDILFEESCHKLNDEIAKGHDYRFVGKVGLFTPVVSGAGGGLLMREKDGKFYAATGSTGFRFKESEIVKSLGEEDKVDKRFYEELVDNAIDAICEYGDFKGFVSDTPGSNVTINPDFMNIPYGVGDEGFMYA